MANNPNPSRISNALWDFWTRFDSHEPTVQLGGIYAPKPGYHRDRNSLSGGDYSVGQVGADRQGPGDKAAAIDLTMSASAMVKYTRRLNDAAKARDKRLYIDGVPIIREFIGTLNNSAVYCYVLTGGVALGVGSDAGADWDRDDTHLWHIHISIIRRFCDSSDAMERLYSVISGESLADWEARHGGGKPTSYTVVSGDTLSKIGSRFAVSVADLASWNGLADPSKIFVGQVLRLSAPSQPSQPSDRTPDGVLINPPNWPTDPNKPFVPRSDAPYYRTVEEWERKMRQRGWSVSVDGHLKLADGEVLRQFQREKGLTADGLLGPVSLRAAWTAPLS